MSSDNSSTARPHNKQEGMVLDFAAKECKADREIVLAAVQQNGHALADAADECKEDREIVLAAVQQIGYALAYAADEYKADREIVMAAVQRTGDALYFAAKECKADRELAVAAVEAQPLAIEHVSGELLLDSTFASEAKRDRYILKVSMLSGRSTAVTSGGDDRAEAIVRECCRHLEMQGRGTTALLHGAEVVPATAEVKNWPGVRPKGEVSECQLVL
eukprot:4528215-Amphidinium_carterae.1